MAATAAVVAGALGLMPWLVVGPASAVAPNVLTANQASVETDLSGLEVGYSAALSRSTAYAAQGTASVALTATTTAGMALRTKPQAAVPGAAYSASVAGRSATGAPQALVQLRFWSATGAALGAWNGAWATLSSSGWTTLSRANAVAPTNAATVSVLVVVQTTAVGAAAYVDQLGLWQAATVQAWSLPGATTTATATTTTAAPAPTTSSPAPAASTPAPATSAPAPATSSPAPTSPTTSTPTNLLTPNQASWETSTSGIEPGYGGLALARTTAAAHDGVSSLEVTATAAGSIAVRTLRGWTAVTAGSGLSASVQVRAGAATAVQRMLVQLRFMTASGSQTGVTVNGPWTTVSSTGWTRVPVSGVVVPTGATSVTLLLVSEKSAAGDVYETDEWGVFASSSLPAWSLPSTQTGPVVVYLGDSMVAGGAASAPLLRWSSLVAASEHWLENNMSRGGTGWVKTSGPAGCGLAYCPSVPEMAVQAVDAQPEVVIVSAGRNDLAIMGTDPASVQKGIADTFATLRAGLPSARIIAVAPLWDATAPSSKFPQMQQWLQESAAAVGATVVPDAFTWLVDHPEWIAADGVHQNDAGHAEVARRVLAALAT